MKADVHAEPVNEGDNLVPRVEVEEVPLSRLVAYFLRLGTVGFGGPIALVGYMQRDLVEDRHWVSTEDYLQGLAFSQLSPGPLAAPLANYLGWVHSGTLGARLAGIVLPSLLMVLALAAMYVHFGQLAWIQGMFYGIGAAVSAIIVRSAWRRIQKTLDKHYLLWTVFAILTVTTVWTESEILSLFVLSGVVAMLIKAPPGGEGTLAKAVIPPLGFVGVYAPAGTKTVMTVFTLLSQSRCVRVWERFSHRAVSLRGRRGWLSLADRTSISGRCSDRDDHPGAGRHHFGIHRLFSGGSPPCLRCNSCGLSAALFVSGFRCAVLSAVCKESSSQSICSRSHGGSGGSYCRRSNHFEQTRGNGFDDCPDCCGFHSSIAVLQENTRTSHHSRSRDRGHDCEARVVVTCLGGT